MNACTRTSDTPLRTAWRMSANRCSLLECTPPSDNKPIRCSTAPGFFAASMAWLMTSFSQMEPSRHAKLMRESSWCTTRPAPMFKCPTSELPICPAGKPTASPEAASFVHEHVSNRRSSVGVFASDTALPGPGSARPKPSMMMRHTGSVNALRTVSFAAITGTLSQAG